MPLLTKDFLFYENVNLIESYRKIDDLMKGKI